jgi:hypothetical protein
MLDKRINRMRGKENEFYSLGWMSVLVYGDLPPSDGDKANRDSFHREFVLPQNPFKSIHLLKASKRNANRSFSRLKPIQMNADQSLRIN